MKRQLFRVLTGVLIAFSAACGVSLRNARVADLQRHPGRYENRTVTVDGIVTDSWGVPLLPYRFYRVDDGTGQIAVLSESLRVPGKESTCASGVKSATSRCSAADRSDCISRRNIST